jgi:integrase
MAKKREYKSGEITNRGDDTWQLRYRRNGRRFSETFKGAETEARERMLDLRSAAKAGKLVEPDKMTFADWLEYWLAIGAPGNKKTRKAGPRAIERYEQLLRRHVIPHLGEERLQGISSTDIEMLYTALEQGTLAQKTQRHVHIVLKACLDAAKRSKKISVNPIEDALKEPADIESDHGEALDAEQLKELLRHFKDSALYPIIYTAVVTGARRNEILALRWTDLNVEKKQLRIERSIEETKKHGRRFKAPKTERGKRVIDVDDTLIALLLEQRDKHRRLVAGVPDGAEVNLLVKLPRDALMFPSTAGAEFDCKRTRNPSSVSNEFMLQARRRFPGLRFHDLRGSHATMLLDNGTSVHTVAARLGHDATVLLKSYAKRTRGADKAAAAKIGALLGMI